MLACSDSATQDASENQELETTLSPCEQSLAHLQEWTPLSTIEPEWTEGMLSACESGVSMTTAHPLECLLLESPEEAAKCGLRLERQPLIDSCIEASGGVARNECETELGAIAPVVLEARMESFRAGYWLDLWACHVLNDGTEITDIDRLVGCGLEVMERLSTGECQMGQVSEQDCVARWQMQAPAVELRLRRSLE